MGIRLYDYELPCGCLISTDKGGGLVPCLAAVDENFATAEEIALDAKSWEEYRSSPIYSVHQSRIKEG